MATKNSKTPKEKKEVPQRLDKNSTATNQKLEKIEEDVLEIKEDVSEIKGNLSEMNEKVSDIPEIKENVSKSRNILEDLKKYAPIISCIVALIGGGGGWGLYKSCKDDRIKYHENFKLYFEGGNEDLVIEKDTVCVDIVEIYNNSIVGFSLGLFNGGKMNVTDVKIDVSCWKSLIYTYLPSELSEKYAGSENVEKEFVQGKSYRNIIPKITPDGYARIIVWLSQQPVYNGDYQRIYSDLVDVQLMADNKKTFHTILSVSVFNMSTNEYATYAALKDGSLENYWKTKDFILMRDAETTTITQVIKGKIKKEYTY